MKGREGKKYTKTEWSGVRTFWEKQRAALQNTGSLKKSSSRKLRASLFL